MSHRRVVVTGMGIVSPIGNTLSAAWDSIQAGVVQRLEAGGQAVVDEGVHLLDVLRRQEGLRIEIAHFTGDAGGVGRGIEVGDLADAAAAGLDAFPGRGQGIADGRDDAHAGDDDATMAHGETPL